MREIIKDFSNGYDLDAGGYQFEGCRVADGEYLYLDAGLDHLPVDREGCDFLVASARYVWSPPPLLWEAAETAYCDALGARLYRREVSLYRKVSSGLVLDSERSCNCHGRPDGARWECTGNLLGDPYPSCERCEGTGYVDSPGFNYATYAAIDSEDTYRHPWLWFAAVSCAQQIAEI